ncbi:MAG TPA: formylglycine-generating enzyme family protein [Steroidobacteraceae bacterium]|jgi:formylglycine-generating enzyme required for sulfatase activity|nr:formylglycine-generating enzyme family protein [Steroidobacteraceae bacterium]
MNGTTRRWLTAVLCGLLASQVFADEPAQTVLVRGGRFESVLPPAAGVKQVSVADFRLDRTQVTNAQFARFVQLHPQWRRDEVAALFADTEYLAHWSSAVEPGARIRNQPVVRVSWFAASAYCEARGARLPTWYEWEYAAAASARAPLDLHEVIWEWVEDFAGMLVAGDNRQQSDPDSLRFCGPGALTMEQKENYATLMRIALLSSMQARSTGPSMGFRCAQ